MVKFTDEMHSRGRRHIEVIIVEQHDLIVAFQGKSIAGLCRVDKEDFSKNGKWSHYTWEVTLAAGAEAGRVHQDWETGYWLNGQNWQAALKEFKANLPKAANLTDACIERFIRASMPKTAIRLDAAVDPLASPFNAAELIAAQEEAGAAAVELFAVKKQEEALIQEYTLRDQAQRDREEANQRKARLDGLKGRKMTFAELQAALAS